MNYNQTSHFHFNDCDPAGIFYFGNVPNLCHRTYENWLMHLKSDWRYWFSNSEWIIPIKNCTIDYQNPMRAGDSYSLELSIKAMSQSSFTTQFHAFNTKTNSTYFKAQIVHVFVQKSDFTKMTIPDSIRTMLEPYLTSRSE